ncbi:Poly-beta-hydroxybutyrate polymerase [Stieleria neptunia]|uniref:Poly(3-hydroxyalkanoate) polymerase subunit PhaC n=1 Tax=Stieleria neptunia TaxID=2527979 RepID=A0A518HKS0_9BACT|nr:class III poly(R)-hydroxyalkanoic acid synthase subunit PhaC [Stieleria neptunia]QDV41438.1 Poly-beta-hydroxybutyrate polymerase [Stieleria neptunia]
MNEPIDEPSATERTWPPLVACWTRAVKQAAENAHQLQQASHPHADPKTHRRQWFGLWGQATEAYLRSSDFLKLLKRHIDTLIDAKLAGDFDPADTRVKAGRLSSDVRALAMSFGQLFPETKSVPNRIHGGGPGGGGGGGVSPQTPDRPSKWATPFEVVYEATPLKLLHFQPAKVRFAEPVLICFALVNRPYILDLKANRSVVRRLLDRGFDVYVIDWGNPDDSDSALRLEDYVCSMLNNAVDFICQRSHSPRLSLLGYCMGGTMSTLYTALHPERIGNLILMAAPIEFDGESGLLNLWARPETFDVDGLIDAFGNCPGEFLQLVFQLMKPVQNFAEKQLSFMENSNNTEFLDDFETIERWSGDTIPIAGETFREFVSMLYQENRLVNNQMVLAGQTIRLAAITCPILLLVAQRDHLVPPESTLAIKERVSSGDVTSLSIEAGHIGLAVGSQAQRNLWPLAAEWIASHSTQR